MSDPVVLDALRDAVMLSQEAQVALSEAAEQLAEEGDGERAAALLAAVARISEDESFLTRSLLAEALG